MPRNYLIPVGSVTTKFTYGGSQLVSNDLTKITGARSCLAAAGSALTSMILTGIRMSTILEVIVTSTN